MRQPEDGEHVCPHALCALNEWGQRRPDEGAGTQALDWTRSFRPTSHSPQVLNRPVPSPFPLSSFDRPDRRLPFPLLPHVVAGLVLFPGTEWHA
eukprot:2513099-Prymnesium_polylepis.1